MSKIVVNTRDDLILLETSLVAAVKANGNYSTVYYINKREILLTMPIGHIDELLKKHNNDKDKFIKLGRSFIINQRYVYRIELQRQLLFLSDGSPADRDLVVRIGKGLLRRYKNAIVASIKITNERIQNKNHPQKNEDNKIRP